MKIHSPTNIIFFQLGKNNLISLNVMKFLFIKKKWKKIIHLLTLEFNVPISFSVFTQQILKIIKTMFRPGDEIGNKQKKIYFLLLFSNNF